jgi:hypothetical protein
LIFFVSAVILAGCVGAASVGKSEITVYQDSITSINTIGGNTAYAQKLADEYLKQATTASETQDAIAFGTIGAAATGAGGLLYNSGFDLIKGAGLAAGTTAAVGNYLKPDETILALLDAAEQLVCIAKSGEMAESQFGQKAEEAGIDTHVVEAVDILGVGIRQARIHLRKKLVRQRPDYTSLLNQLSNTASASAKVAVKMAVDGRDSLAAPEIVEKLRGDVAKCLLIAI